MDEAGVRFEFAACDTGERGFPAAVVADHARPAGRENGGDVRYGRVGGTGVGVCDRIEMQQHDAPFRSLLRRKVHGTSGAVV